MANLAQEIVITLDIHASPARVYAAFTRPEGWCAWCCEKAESDARLGGRLHIYTEGYNAYGEFIELEPARSVTFTWNGDREPPMIIHVRLAEIGDNTRLTFKVNGLGTEQAWTGIVDFLERIWGHVLNNLKSVLEAKPEL